MQAARVREHDRQPHSRQAVSTASARLPSLMGAKLTATLRVAFKAALLVSLMGLVHAFEDQEPDQAGGGTVDAGFDRPNYLPKLAKRLGRWEWLLVGVPVVYFQVTVILKWGQHCNIGWIKRLSTAVDCYLVGGVLTILVLSTTAIVESAKEVRNGDPRTWKVYVHDKVSIALPEAVDRQWVLWYVAGTVLAGAAVEALLALISLLGPGGPLGEEPVTPDELAKYVRGFSIQGLVLLITRLPATMALFKVAALDASAECEPSELSGGADIPQRWDCITRGGRAECCDELSDLTCFWQGADPAGRGWIVDRCWTSEDEVVYLKDEQWDCHQELRDAFLSVNKKLLECIQEKGNIPGERVALYFVVGCNVLVQFLHLLWMRRVGSTEDGWDNEQILRHVSVAIFASLVFTSVLGLTAIGGYGGADLGGPVRLWSSAHWTVACCSIGWEGAWLHSLGVAVMGEALGGLAAAL